MYKLINERLELLNSLIRNEIFLEIAPKTKLADMLNFEKEFNDKRIELLNSLVRRELIYKLGPKADFEEVINFEKEYNVKLPSDYRDFILNYGNCIKSKYKKIFEPIDFKSFNKFGESFNPSIPFKLTKALKCYEDDFFENRKIEYDIIEDDSSIFDFMNGFLYVDEFAFLIINGKEYGNIWKTETYNSAVYPIYTKNRERVTFLPYILEKIDFLITQEFKFLLNKYTNLELYISNFKLMYSTMFDNKIETINEKNEYFIEWLGKKVLCKLEWEFSQKLSIDKLSLFSFYLNLNSKDSNKIDQLKLNLIEEILIDFDTAVYENEDIDISFICELLKYTFSNKFNNLIISQKPIVLEQLLDKIVEAALSKLSQNQEIPELIKYFNSHPWFKDNEQIQPILELSVKIQKQIISQEKYRNVIKFMPFYILMLILIISLIYLSFI
jgi:hypothetical protein